MKKFLTLLGMAVLLPILAHTATGPVNGGYWRGEASPGRLVDSSANGNNLTQVSDPGNPGSPAPFEGSLWLGGGGSAGQYEIPVGAISDYAVSNTAEFGARFNAGSGDFYFIIWYDGGSGINDLKAHDNGDGTFQFTFDEFGHGIPFSVAVSEGVNHHIRVQFPQTGNSDGSVTIDGSTVVATFTRSSAMVPTDHFELANVGSGAAAYMDAVMIARGWSDVYPGPANPTPTPTFTATRTATRTASPTITVTSTRTYTTTASPTRTMSHTFSPTLTATPPWTHTPTPTPSPTISRTFSVTRTITSSMTRSPTVTVTPTAHPGTLSFSYVVTNQIYVTWPGTNINPGNGSTVFAAYGPKSGSTYPYSAGGGYDPVHDVFFATIPRAWPLYVKGRIINGQGTFSTAEGFAYGPYTLTPSPTITVTLTQTPVVTVTPSVTKTSTYTVTPTPVVTNVTVDTSIAGQTYITWESTANVSPSMYVYVQYGTTTAYGFQAAGGYDADNALFFATVPRDANAHPFHFRCAVQNSRGVSRSADFTAP